MKATIKMGEMVYEGEVRVYPNAFSPSHFTWSFAPEFRGSFPSECLYGIDFPSKEQALADTKAHGITIKEQS